MKTKLILLIPVLLTVVSGFAQKYEYRIVTTVESLIPSGIGRSRMITSNETRDYKTLTISRSEEENSRNPAQRSDIRVKAFDESELLNLYNLGGIRFQNIVANDAIVSSKLNAMADEGWDLTFVNSGIESDAGKADDNAIFITRYVFRRVKKTMNNESPVSLSSNFNTNPKNQPVQSFNNNNNNTIPENNLKIDQALKNNNTYPDNNNNNNNAIGLSTPGYIKNTPAPEQQELNTFNINLFEKPLRSTIKRNGSIFSEPNFNKEIVKISSGTVVQVLGHGNGFWKVKLNDIDGFIDSGIIYITFEMAKYLQK